MDGFAANARQLGPDNTIDPEAGRHIFQFFGDILANFLEFASTIGAGFGWRYDLLVTGQMIGQGFAFGFVFGLARNGFNIFNGAFRRRDLFFFQGQFKLVHSLAAGTKLLPFHARQLVKACRRGLVQGPVVVVDRDPRCRAARELGCEAEVRVATSDWLAYLDSAPDMAPAGWLVPAPFTPHLPLQWLAAQATRAGATVSAPTGDAPAVGAPVEGAGADGARFLSVATWTCPATCVEPAVCPHTRGPRDWDLGAMVEAYAEREGSLTGALMFRCRQLAQGIGAIPMATFLHNRERVLRRAGAGRPARWAVATASYCHGAMDLLDVSPLPAGGP